MDDHLSREKMGGTHMDKKLQELLDHFEITKVLKEYCHAVDRMDHARMAAVYARDSWDDHGPNKCSGQEFAARIIGLMRSSTTVSSSHMLGQSMIVIDGDTAGADTYFLASGLKIENGGQVINQMAGRYVDVFVREQGSWKIKSRTCVHDWSISLPISGDWLGKSAYIQGKRSGEDPSYSVLGLRHSDTR
jgi:ketosteroid isomerase-like protein